MGRPLRARPTRAYTTPATATTDNGSTFTVKVSNVAGSQTSTAATLTVNLEYRERHGEPAAGRRDHGRRADLHGHRDGDPNHRLSPGRWTASPAALPRWARSRRAACIRPRLQPARTPSRRRVWRIRRFRANASVAVTDLTGVTTQRYDNSRDGQNLQEYALTSSVLSTAGAFGKVFTCTISDGPVYAQPLYVANLAIARRHTQRGVRRDSAEYRLRVRRRRLVLHDVLAYDPRSFGVDTHAQQRQSGRQRHQWPLRDLRHAGDRPHDGRALCGRLDLRQRHELQLPPARARVSRPGPRRPDRPW